MTLLQPRRGRERLDEPRVALAHRAGVRPQVELRQVQPEDLDPAPQRRKPAVGDACAAVRPQARVEQLELGEQLVGRARTRRRGAGARSTSVAAGTARRRSARAATSGTSPTAAIDLDELGRDPPASARARARPAASSAGASDRACSSAASTVSAPACGLPSRSPPIQVPKRSGERAAATAAAQLAQLGEQPRRRRPEALLEEPEPVADLVDDARPARANLVGLPEDRHLLREIGPRARARRTAAARGRRARAAARRSGGGRAGRAPRGLGGMRGEDELHREPADGLPQLVVRDAGFGEPATASRERLARGSGPRARTRAGGGAGGAARRCSRAGRRARMPAGRAPGSRRSSAPTTAASSTPAAASPLAAGPREQADALLDVEQLLALLLDDDLAEDLPEQPHVGAERIVRPSPLRPATGVAHAAETEPNSPCTETSVAPCHSCGPDEKNNVSFAPAARRSRTRYPRLRSG